MRRRGFTLIELLVVIAVMGAVMALVGPFGIEQIAKGERLQETRQLQSILQHQAQTAFLTGNGYEITFDGQQLIMENTSTKKTATLDFKHIFFTPHTTYLNLNGVYTTKEIEYFSAGQPHKIDLSYLEPGRE
jgi:prepilin-type N-terminal cleavage/methylation domain-containing protein